MCPPIAYGGYKRVRSLKLGLQVVVDAGHEAQDSYKVKAWSYLSKPSQPTCVVWNWVPCSQGFLWEPGVEGVWEGGVKAHDAFKRDSVPTCQLTTVWNSSPKGYILASVDTSHIWYRLNALRTFHTQKLSLFKEKKIVRCGDACFNHSTQEAKAVSSQLIQVLDPASQNKTNKKLNITWKTLLILS